MPTPLCLVCKQQEQPCPVDRVALPPDRGTEWDSGSVVRRTWSFCGGYRGRRPTQGHPASWDRGTWGGWGLGNSPVPGWGSVGFSVRTTDREYVRRDSTSGGPCESLSVCHSSGQELFGDPESNQLFPAIGTGPRLVLQHSSFPHSNLCRRHRLP